MKPMYVEIPLFIKENEIDNQGFVIPIHYMRWFEELRYSIFDKHYPNKDMINEQYSPILVSRKPEFFISVTIHDKPIGKAWLSSLGKTTWKMILEIYVNDKLYCQCKKTGTFYDLNKKKQIAFPQWFIEIYNLNKKGYDFHYPKESDYDEITAIWEASVRKTHTFLAEEDVAFFKPMVRNQALYGSDLICIKNESSQIVAFMGIEGDKLEMLFIHPNERSKGLGKILLTYATGKKGVTKVDVNEQNEQAVGFYHHQGFEVISRDAIAKLFRRNNY